MVQNANRALFAFGEEARTEQPEPGVTRQILIHDEGLMLVRVRFRKGAVGYVHSHLHRQITYVESGRFEAELDGRKQELGAGDCYLVPPHVPHGVVALEEGALLDVFTPRRDDFLA